MLETLSMRRAPRVHLSKTDAPRLNKQPNKTIRMTTAASAKPAPLLIHTTAMPQAAISPLIALMLAQTSQPSIAPTDTQPSDEISNPNDEVVITWTGRLLVEPEESPPIDIAGPDDTLVEMVGSPVRITTERNEIITAASVDYLASAGRVRIIGSATHPMTVQSPSMGVLKAHRLVLHQDQGTGQIIGAGSLHSRPQRSDTDLPDGLVITWQDRVDLNFYVQNTPTGTRQDPNRIDALKDALFRGRAHVTHPQFELDSDQLVVDLTSPETGKQSLQAINATGNVQAVVHGSDDQPPIDVQSDKFAIDFAEQRDADGVMKPTRLVMAGNVNTRQPGRSIQAGELEIALEALPEETPDSVANNADAIDENAIDGDVVDTGVIDGLSVSAEGRPLPVSLASESSPVPDIQTHGENTKALSFAEERILKERQDKLPVPTTTETTNEMAPLNIAKAEGDAGNNTEDEKAGENDEGTTRYGVSTVTARENVIVTLDEPGVQLFANRLVADTLADQIELFGLPGQPAHVDRYDGSLAGDHIVLNHEGQSVHVIGPGKATFLSGNTQPTDEPETPAGLLKSTDANNASEKRDR